MNDADHAVAPMNPDPAKPPARARRLRTPYKLRLLDPALREEFDRRLREERWSCGELSQWLAERGAELSPSGVNYYYRHHFLPNLNAVKIACVETAAAVRESGGDDEAINRKLGSLVQGTMFQLLVEMNRVREMARAAKPRQRSRKRARSALESGEEGLDTPAAPTKAELVALAAFARAAVAFRKSDLDQSKWAMEKARIAQQLAAAGKQVEDAARGGGLSAAAEEQIRAALTEIRL